MPIRVVPSWLNQDARRCSHCGRDTPDGLQYWVREFLHGRPEDSIGRRRSGAQQVDPPFDLLRFEGQICVHCHKVEVVMRVGKVDQVEWEGDDLLSVSCSLDGDEVVVYPIGAGAPQVHAGVPTLVARSLLQAHAVKHASPNAAGVLCRRSLQALVRLLSGKQSNSFRDEVKSLPEPPPPRVAESMWAIWELGAVGGHPRLDAAGEIDLDERDVEHLLALLWEVISHFFPAPSSDHLAELGPVVAAKGRRGSRRQTPQS